MSEQPTSSAPQVSPDAVIAVLQRELEQTQANRIWLLARNLELEQQLREAQTPAPPEDTSSTEE